MIAIKGMELPKNCLDCPVRNYRDGEGNRCDLTGLCNREDCCPLVEIVTCKNCKHRDPEDKFCDCGHAIKWSSPREDNFFCADAERIE